MFEGVLTALVTPFRDGAIDEPALRELIEFQIESDLEVEKLREQRASRTTFGDRAA